VGVPKALLHHWGEDLGARPGGEQGCGAGGSDRRRGKSEERVVVEEVKGMRWGLDLRSGTSDHLI